MGIDFYINSISDVKVIGKGFQSKCYDFGDVVLLESRYLSKVEVQTKINEVSIMKNKLESINVNSYKIIDYKVFNDRLYILETKVFGNSLQDTAIGIDSSVFINRLKELDNIDVLKNFVSDYLKLCDNGVYVDPGTPNNFLFDGSRVSFIDLGLSSGEIDKKYICFYIIRNIIYTFSDISSDDVSIISFYVNNIYNKLCMIYSELGYGIDMYTLTPNGSITDFINRKINNFVKDDLLSKGTKGI